MNIKFNTKERFENLLKATTELGFEKEKKQYEDILAGNFSSKSAAGGKQE